MKCPAVVLGVVLFAATVGAQSNFNGPRPLAAPAAAATGALASVSTSAPLLFAEASPNSADVAFTAVAAVPVSSPGANPAAAQQVSPLGVSGSYNWQLYAGYTFFNFYEVPNFHNVENGFDLGVTYYPGGGRFGGEGDLMATFGGQAGCISKFTLASGGVRVRWQGPEGTQFWVHGLVGGTHFFPQTAYGSQNALGYVMGGGVDVDRAGWRRLALRLEVDAVGTRFFGSYQYSPKVSAGIVFKF